MKKKIYIITFWNEINYGAVLQMYSLVNLLKKKYEVKVIKYFNIKHFFLTYFINISSNLNIIKNIKKIFLFKNFLKKIKFTKFYYGYNKIILENIIVGSDEIWNLNHKFNKNNFLYFGEKIKFKNIFSYAPSFGSISYNKLSLHQKEKIKFYLKKFNKITVRDISSQNLLKKLNINSELTLDPIFFIKKKITYSNNIIVYGKIVKNNYCKLIKKIARDKNCKIISLGYYNNWCDESIIDCDIGRFINFFSSANIVVTNMLHGEFLAINFKKKLIRIINKRKKNKFSHIFSKILKNKISEQFIIDTAKITKIVDKERIKSKKILNTEIGRFK